MSLPSKRHNGFPHAESGVYYCCNNVKASKEDSERVERTGVPERVNCVNCHSNFILSKTVHGLHIGRLTEND